MNKPTRDVNNLKDNERKGDHLYSDIMGEPKNTKSQRTLGLKSSEVNATSDWS